jgi:hypothetical protein
MTKPRYHCDLLWRIILLIGKSPSYSMQSLLPKTHRLQESRSPSRSKATLSPIANKRIPPNQVVEPLKFSGLLAENVWFSTTSLKITSLTTTVEINGQDEKPILLTQQSQKESNPTAPLYKQSKPSVSTRLTFNIPLHSKAEPSQLSHDSTDGGSLTVKSESFHESTSIQSLPEAASIEKSIGGKRITVII